MSCVVVGNGTSLLDKENGVLIDSFDIVARFNAYTTDGVEQFTGIKTDYWFNVINFQNRDSEWRVKRQYQRVYLHSWQWDPQKDRLYQDFLTVFPTNLLIKTVKRDVDEIAEFADTPKYRCYSTGAIAIWILLREMESVVITGFDWWNREEHHYNDRAIRGTLHQPQIEKMFIDKLAKQGRIRFLE
jgi:hypothetical protein